MKNVELLFRAWDEIKKEMIYPISFEMTNGYIIDNCRNIMQYTGYNDND